MVLFLTAGKTLPSHDLCPETFPESLDHGQEDMVERRVKGGESIAFDAGSSEDHNSGRLECRIFLKWTILILTSVKKTIMSLNHSSVNRLSFCSVSLYCSIWCTYVEVRASTLGVIF